MNSETGASATPTLASKSPGQMPFSLTVETKKVLSALNSFRSRPRL